MKSKAPDNTISIGINLTWGFLGWNSLSEGIYTFIKLIGCRFPISNNALLSNDEISRNRIYFKKNTSRNFFIRQFVVNNDGFGFPKNNDGDISIVNFRKLCDT